MGSGKAATFDLSGKVVLITGGGSGIGAGISTVLAEAGATVVIADRDEAGARREVEALTAAGHTARHRRRGVVLRIAGSTLRHQSEHRRRCRLFTHLNHRLPMAVDFDDRGA